MLKYDEIIMKKYNGYFKEYYKEMEIRQSKSGFDINKKVTFGGIRVSVVTVTNHLYPSFYVKNEPAEIVLKYKEVEHRIKQVHDMVRIYHATHIRPKLLSAPSWGSFIKTKCLNVLSRDTFLGFIFKIDGFSNPENITNFMDENMSKVRDYQLHQFVRQCVDRYIKLFACGCSFCRKLSTMDWHVAISDAFKGLKDNADLNETVVRTYVWDRMEIYYDYWTKIRNVSTVFNTEILNLPSLAFKKSTEELKSMCILIEMLLKDGYNGNDIYAAFLKGSRTREEFENGIALLVRHRQRCYCGRKRPMLSVSFCTKHHLCSQCCKYKGCMEEDVDMMTDDDSEQEVTYISD
jgi:hypothetical protein